MEGEYLIVLQMGPCSLLYYSTILNHIKDKMNHTSGCKKTWDITFFEKIKYNWTISENRNHALSACSFPFHQFTIGVRSYASKLFSE